MADEDEPLEDDADDADDGKPSSSKSPPPPRNRKGRISDEEMEERIDFTMFLRSRMLYKSDIVKQLKKKYGVDARTTESYLSRARERLVENYGKPALEHEVDSYSFYASVIRNPEATEREKLSARERLDWLLLGGRGAKGGASDGDSGDTGGSDTAGDRTDSELLAGLRAMAHEFSRAENGTAKTAKGAEEKTVGTTPIQPPGESIP